MATSIPEIKEYFGYETVDNGLVNHPRCKKCRGESPQRIPVSDSAVVVDESAEWIADCLKSMKEHAENGKGFYMEMEEFFSSEQDCQSTVPHIRRVCRLTIGPGESSEDDE